MIKATIQQTDANQRGEYATAIDHEMLVCESCDRRLVDIVVIGDAAPAEPTQYKADCPFCGDCSQIAELSGTARFMAEDGVQVVDIDMSVIGEPSFSVPTAAVNRFTIVTEKSSNV